MFAVLDEDANAMISRAEFAAVTGALRRRLRRVSHVSRTGLRRGALPPGAFARPSPSQGIACCHQLFTQRAWVHQRVRELRAFSFPYLAAFLARSCWLPPAAAGPATRAAPAGRQGGERRADDHLLRTGRARGARPAAL